MLHVPSVASWHSYAKLNLVLLLSKVEKALIASISLSVYFTKEQF